MYLQQISRHAFRAVLFAAAVTFSAATVLPAQQSTDSTRATTVSPVPDSAAHVTTPWRNYVSQTDTMAPRTAPNRAFAPGSVDGGSNTIVISTLGLVLIVVIVVLLIR